MRWGCEALAQKEGIGRGVARPVGVVRKKGALMQRFQVGASPMHRSEHDPRPDNLGGPGGNYAVTRSRACDRPLAPLLVQDQFLAPSRPQSRGFNTGPLGSFYGGAKFAGPPLWSLSCVAFVGHYRVDRRLSLRDHSGVITPLVSLHFVRCPHRPYGVLVTPLLNGIIARSSRFDGPKVFKDLIGLRR